MTSIRHDVHAEEVAEVADNNIANTGISKMFVDKRCEGGKPTIGHWLAIDTGNDITFGHLLTLKERFTETLCQPSSQQGIKETDAQNCTTALIAKDIAQRRRVLNDAATIIETTVRTSPQNTCYSRLATADGDGSPQQVTMSLNMLSFRKNFCNQLAHKQLKLSTYTASVEVNLRWKERHLRQQLITQDTDNSFLLLMERIDALRPKTGNDVTRLHQSPISLRTATICN